jgi:MFS family permease
MTRATKTLHNNFLLTAFLFAINHGALLSCLGLANARLGNTIASSSSSILYGCFTGFALLGAPYVVKVCGAQRGLILGMALCGTYVASFGGVVGLCYDDNVGEDTINIEELIKEQNNACSKTLTTLGAVLGGIGSSILWTSQGSFFTSTSLQYAYAIRDREIPMEKITSLLGGEWAFIFLSIEVCMRVLSTVLVDVWRPSRSDISLEFDGLSWKSIFGVYTLLAMGAVGFMLCVPTLPDDVELDVDAVTEIGNFQTDRSALLPDESNENYGAMTQQYIANRNAKTHTTTPFRQAVAAIDLLLQDEKMKYLSFLNITFGLCTAFCTSVVNGQVIRVALNDDNSQYVGMFTAVTSLVAAMLSWSFGILDWMSHTFISEPQSSSPKYRFIKFVLRLQLSKGVVLTLGAVSYLLIALLFLLFPSFSSWDFSSLMMVYILLGVGRSTYEGTLRAVIADFFPHEKEGAFANQILFNGVASVIGYWSNEIASSCSFSDDNRSGSDNLYCVRFNDGSVHNLFLIESVIIVSAVLGIIGFWKANALHVQERRF